jgi:hypothetical protein
VPGGGGQITIAEPGAGAGRLARDRARRLPVTCPQMLLGDGDEQVGSLDGRGCVLVEEPLRPREPSARGLGLAAHEEAEADPEGAAGRARSIARVPVRLVGPLQRALELLLTPDQERRRRQPLEVRRAQGALAIGQGQEVVGVPPGAAVVGAPAAIQVSPRHVLSMNPDAPRSTGSDM